MRSNKLLSALLFLSVFAGLLVVPVYAADENHTPTMIIPTKFRFLLIDMVQAMENQGTPAQISGSLEIPESEDSHGSASTDSGTDEEILSAGLTSDKSYGGFGKGFVQTNFDVSFQEPGRKIDNRERLTARGLFNVHVVHEFN